MPLLEVIGVSKHFGGLSVLSDVSFNVDEGEIVGLIGPNGAGKTTLFNLINSVYSLDKGVIKFEGNKISGKKPHQVCRKGVARTFQITKSFAGMNVLENVMIGSLFGKDAVGSVESASKEAIRLLEFTGLIEKASMPVEGLTAVDRRGIEVARALAAKPRILLLDEVMAGLNPSEITGAMKLIQRIRSDLGATILMIEHIMRSVMNISDRVIVLASGVKIAVGTPKEVSEDPVVIQAYLGETQET